MERNRFKSRSFVYPTSSLKDSGVVRLGADSPSMASVSLTNAPATSSTPTSVLYSVLLRALVSRRAAANNLAEGSLHSPFPVHDMDGLVTEALRAQVARLFPFCGVIVESTSAVDLSEMTPTQCASSSTPKGEEGGEGSRCRIACIASANAYRHLCGSHPSDPRVSEASALSSPFTHASSPPATRETSNNAPKRRAGLPKVVFKSAPSSRTALAAVAAAVARSPSKVASAEAPKRLSASPPADSSKKTSSRVGGAAQDQRASSWPAPRATVESPQRFTVVPAPQLPVMQRHLEELFDDFAAAIGQCHSALSHHQLESGSLAAWQTSGEKRGVHLEKPRVSSLGADDSASQHRGHSPPCTTSNHRHRNSNILVADVTPGCSSHRFGSDLFSHGCMADELGHTHGTTTAVNGSSRASLTRGAMVESEREAHGASGQIMQDPKEEEELSRGIVIMAHTIAEHLYAILHPTSTVAAPEEALAALPGHKSSNTRGTDEPTTLHAATTAVFRRSHAAVAQEEKRSTSCASFASLHFSPAEGASRLLRSPQGSTCVSPELRELQQLVHTLLWSRITTYLRKLSLKTTEDSSSASHSTNAVERREACASVQLSFWIWLYAASGLATDVIRGQQETQRAPANPGHLVGLHESITSSSSTTCVPPPLSLPQLLPTVETLARQLQRRVYMRVQSTPETLLTVNTFLSFSGVQMTDRTVMERLFPLQSGLVASDALGVAELFPDPEQRVTHDASVGEEPLSGGVKVSVFDTAAAAPPFIRIGASPDKRISLGDHHTMPVLGVAGAILVDGSGSLGGDTRRSPPHRGWGASCAVVSGAGSKASPSTSEEMQKEHNRRSSGPSTAELYLQWLESADPAHLTLCASQERPNCCLDRVEVDVNSTVGVVASSRISPQQYRAESIAYTNPDVSLFADDSEVGERDGDTARKDNGNRGGRRSSESSCNYTMAQPAGKLFRVVSVMPSADLAPCLMRVEKELHQGNSAVQFARKLGTLYATQDMNTLLPLLPAVAQEEFLSPDVNLTSTLTEGGAVESLGAAVPPRGGTDGLGIPAGPAAPAGSVRSQSTWTENPTTGNAVAGRGAPPPAVMKSHVASDGFPGNQSFFCSRRATASAASPLLFPTATFPSTEQKLLMENLNSCRDAIAANSSRLFVDSARALEVALSFALVLLSHVMSEAVPKGDDVPTERMTSVLSSGENSVAAVLAKAATETVTAAEVKKCPSRLSAVAATPLDTSEGRASTKTVEALPPLQSLPLDLAKVFGLGSSRSRWQHLSAYLRETLISVFSSALQRKDAPMMQVLLQYIALDTAISHHYAQVRRLQMPTTPAPLKGAEQTKQVGRSTLKKKRDAAIPSGHQAIHLSASLPDSLPSFVNVWFSSFASLADTTTHLFEGDHHTPSSLKGAVWHLAGLAEYFLLTRARGYDMYGGRCHLCSTALPGCCCCCCDNAAEIDPRISSAPSKAALQNFIASHLVEPAGKVLGAVVAFMDSVCKVLSADTESGAAAERQLREGVLFADDSSDDESMFMSTVADASVHRESACEPTAPYGSESGGAYDIRVNHSEISDSHTCWMELAIHYFLEIVDVLLDVALYLPEKPLYLYQLTVSVPHTGATSTDFMDGLATVSSTGVAGSLPLCGFGDTPVSVSAAAPRVVTDSPLGRVQEFLSMYTSMVLQSAVNYFTRDGKNAQFRFATAHGTLSNPAAAPGGASQRHSSHLFWERLWYPMAASLASTTHGNFSFATRQSPPSASTPTSAQAATAATNAAVSPEAPAGDLYMSGTMWWPGARFQRDSHLSRILEHAQLVSLYLNSSLGKGPAPRALNLLYPEAPRAPRDCSPSLQVSAVTSLLNTSTGPCAQLLSIPYACPQSAVDTSDSGCASGIVRTGLHERFCSHCAGSPVEEPPGCFPVTEHRRLMREVCGGLWIRVELLRLLRLAAAPLDTDTFVIFTSTASKVAARVQDKGLQAHYKTIASIKAGTESVVPKTYASTYVRLLFLRYVQAFYADIQALGASRPALVPDYVASERMDSSGNATSPNYADISNRGDAMPYRTLGSPRMRSPVSPFQHLSQHLWTHYCRELLLALRTLCWSYSEAHKTAANLSIASVFGRLLQMISGRREFDGDEIADDYNDSVNEVQDETNQSSRGVGMPAISFDRSLAPYSTAEGDGKEVFGDFSDSSSDSAVTVAPVGSKGGREALPGRSQKSFSLGNLGRRQDPMQAGLWTSLPKSSTRTRRQVVANVSDSAPVSKIKDGRRLGSNHHSTSSVIKANGRGAASLTISSGSAPAPPRSTAAAPPVKPRLSLTGLRPPLYFASSGDTAAAQEDNFYREQSNQRDITDRFCRTRSFCVADATSYVSQDEEDDEEFGMSYGAVLTSSKYTPPKSASRENRKGDTTASPNARSATTTTSSGAPIPPALKMPKLCLGALGPPLYFTSTGDTGVFAESTMAPSLRHTTAAAFQALKWPTPAPSAMVGAVHVDAAATGAPLKAGPEAAKARTLPPPPPLSAPALPTAATTTAVSFVLPKLSFDSLGPPLYFTSTGDTGGFVEAQTQRLPVAAGAAASAHPSADADCLRPAFTTQVPASGGEVIHTTATASAMNVPNRPSAATAAARLCGSLSSFVSNSSSVFSSFSDCAPKEGDAGGGTNEGEEGGNGVGRTVQQCTKEQVKVRRYGGSVSSLNSLPIREGGLLSLPTGQQRRRQVSRTSRLVLTPVVAPVVTVELILSICSIILQQGSGMIQYAYTVSSLTQKRLLPGMSSSSQRRWHTGSGSAAAASGVTFTQNTNAVQGDRRRYTPQHSPSSFHVIQAMHNYLKDSRNKLVIDLLEEWVLEKYASTERTRMVFLETVYAPSRQQGCSAQTPHLLFPYSINSNSNSEYRHHPQQPYAGIIGGKSNAAMFVGRYVLLRLLLPRVITPLVTQKSERRIGAGGYGSVTSGFVQELGTDCETQLPPEWGQQGSRWRPAEASGGPASGCSGTRGGGSGGGGNTPHSACKGPSFATTAERVPTSVLDGMRAPWRAAAQRIAQAVCRCEVAIKHIPLSARGSESGNLPLCHAEVLAMYRLCGHPHIVPLLSFDNTKDEYILVLPHYTQGSLRVWRQKYYPLGCAVLKLPPGVKGSRKSAPTSTTTATVTFNALASVSAPNTSLFATCARCLFQVLKAVTFMHDHHIRHGDIKCDNVLIAASDAGTERGKMDPPMLPSSVCLCDFGSCDTCDDDDMRNLKHDIMAGETRFLAGRWGVGRGTEAIQPPELMSAKRRYTLLRRIMEAAAPDAAAAAPSPSSSFAISERLDGGAHATSIAGSSAECAPFRSRAGELTGRQVTERLRRAELSADIWACGCLLYEMLTGRMLFGEARLGRLLVLAAADDDENQGTAIGISKTNMTAGTLPPALSPTRKTTVATKANLAGDEGFGFTSSISRKALDDWERDDLQAAVGERVVNFMSALLDLDPLQRPSAHEALYCWEDIMAEAGLEV
ncbi:hypothetical protein JKF63_00262 [Porcisia hertigi]|uniref:Protein kinase domain-containing protein n=1 Tax=Porcisia hertigi TaxID=2761500 RepID=A0A836HYR3_9TRYP|nr:hypothetical protein JKF63_00262 [Porcisia hertigi]